MACYLTFATFWEQVQNVTLPISQTSLLWLPACAWASKSWIWASDPNPWNIWVTPPHTHSNLMYVHWNVWACLLTCLVPSSFPFRLFKRLWLETEVLGLLLDSKPRYCFSLIKCHAILTVALIFWSSSVEVSTAHPQCQGRATIALKQVKRSCDNLFPHRIAHMCHTVYWSLVYNGPVSSGHQGVQLNAVHADMPDNGFIIDFSLSITFILCPSTHTVAVSSFLYSCIQRFFFMLNEQH